MQMIQLAACAAAGPVPELIPTTPSNPTITPQLSREPNTHPSPVASPAGNANGSLCNGWQHLVDLQDRCDVLGHVQALEACIRQQRGAALTLLQLAQAGLVGDSSGSSSGREGEW